jgi:predicted DCC family thiol-disulfide oxidoreductase YuxK
VPATASNAPILVFDGDCGFCTTSALWIEHRLPPGARVEPWQRLDLGLLGLTERDVQTAAYWIDERGRAHRGHEAIARALIAAGGAWKVIGALLLLPPLSWLARAGYHLVANYRDKLPGGTPACKL